MSPGLLHLPGHSSGRLCLPRKPGDQPPAGGGLPAGPEAPPRLLVSLRPLPRRWLAKGGGITRGGRGSRAAGPGGGWGGRRSPRSPALMNGSLSPGPPARVSQVPTLPGPAACPGRLPALLRAPWRRPRPGLGHAAHPHPAWCVVLGRGHAGLCCPGGLRFRIRGFRQDLRGICSWRPECLGSSRLARGLRSRGPRLPCQAGPAALLGTITHRRLLLFSAMTPR